MSREWPYKNIPVKPELFRVLEGIKADAEKDLGTNIVWTSFILAVFGDGVGTGLDIAVAKAIKNYRKKRGKTEEI